MLEYQKLKEKYVDLEFICININGDNTVKEYKIKE